MIFELQLAGSMLGASGVSGAGRAGPHDPGANAPQLERGASPEPTSVELPKVQDVAGPALLPLARLAPVELRG